VYTYIYIYIERERERERETTRTAIIQILLKMLETGLRRAASGIFPE
jgi:hypothetical protein